MFYFHLNKQTIGTVQLKPMTDERQNRPILSADISAINLAVEIVLISPRKSGDKIGQFYRSSVISLTHRIIEMAGCQKSKCSSSWLPIITFTCIIWFGIRIDQDQVQVRNCKLHMHNFEMV